MIPKIQHQIKPQFKTQFKKFEEPLGKKQEQTVIHIVQMNINIHNRHLKELNCSM